MVELETVYGRIKNYIQKHLSLCRTAMARPGHLPEEVCRRPSLRAPREELLLVLLLLVVVVVVVLVVVLF